MRSSKLYFYSDMFSVCRRKCGLAEKDCLDRHFPRACRGSIPAENSMRHDVNVTSEAPLARPHLLPGGQDGKAQWLCCRLGFICERLRLKTGNGFLRPFASEKNLTLIPERLIWDCVPNRGKA